MNDSDPIDTFEYTVVDVIEEEPLDIVRFWKFIICDDNDGTIRRTTVEVSLSHDVSATYESNMDTTSGREVEVTQVPESVRERLAQRLERDVTHIRELEENSLISEFVSEFDEE